ncbi:MAG TPA: hydroxymethylbilane synthase [Chlamydiales bacterium]|nr:hydroxymethylbilane synthase [Chlamydiales bacterium]
MKIVVGARSSPLSRAQVAEVFQEIIAHHPSLEFFPHWTSSPGDRDRITSLRLLGQTDFFTKDLDELLLRGDIRIAIHSAKDLPQPLLDELAIVAMTKGVDPRDSLVFSSKGFKKGGIVGVSSVRREEELKKIDPTLRFVDLRGTIEERLSLLKRGEVDGVVIAEAALIRLQLTDLPRKLLDAPTPLLQGRLAILAKGEDEEMQKIFSSIHYA